MTVFAWLRGHQIETTGSTTDMADWVWADTKEPVLENERPCTRCGRMPVPIHSRWGADACLGKLPGVKAACCGHGDDSRAYVLFDDGTGFEGAEAIKAIDAIRKG